jgi:uncharacterized protein
MFHDNAVATRWRPLDVPTAPGNDTALKETRMKLENTFNVPVPVDETWQVLLDVERIAPCVPGATLTSHDGDSFGGKVKVKLGPIGLTYGGTATFLSQDHDAKVAVIEASGRETRGSGTAKAVVTCKLVSAGDTTDVLVETDLAITGKPAQFGRSTLADVAGTLIGQFATNLADEITNGSATDAADTSPSAGLAEPPLGDGAAVGAVAPADVTATAAPAVAAVGAVAPGDVTATAAPAAVAADPTATPPTATAAAPTATTSAASPAAAAAAATPPAGTATATAPRRPRPASEPIDLLATASGGKLKRAAGPAVAVLVVALVLWRRRS